MNFMKKEIKGIYLIERIGDESDEEKRYYVGQALDIFTRLNQHCSNKNPGVDDAIARLGEESFSFRILEKVKFAKDLNKCETKWINHYRNLYGDKQMYNIAQTTNESKKLDSQIKAKIVELFKEDIGRSIYAIAEYFDIDYEDVINVRKPLLKKNGLKWIKGKIIDEGTGMEAKNWRGYQFTQTIVDEIKTLMKEPNFSVEDIRFVSKSDLDKFLETMEEYQCAPSVV